MARPVRLVLPHQLFAEHLDVPRGTVLVLVEHDLLVRQYAFHAQKLVLHRAGMRRFAERLRAAGHDVEVVESRADRSSHDGLVALLRRLRPTGVSVVDVVDDWLGRDLSAALEEAGHRLRPDEVLESPGFLTTRRQLVDALGGSRSRARMQHFYAWQRRRLDVLVDGDEPAGGRWSFDEENRRSLPAHVVVPAVPPVAERRHSEVEAAISWVRDEFPDAPGDPDAFAWPTSHEEAAESFEVFLDERFGLFGPYEDAISAHHDTLFHSRLTPSLNTGLVSPAHVVERVLEVAERDGVPLPTVEGFVRQVIGWREYMRGTYHLWGRRLRTGNRLGHTRPLAPGWWDATTGLEPVDLVVRRVLDNGWAHHIERLMVLGNAMTLLRTDPDDAYRWFMEMFVDAYDWVMVPNVYAMSQFAAGEAVTTKPYVSGSAYLRRMSDIPAGPWTAEWDALYWTFVRDHADVLGRNARSRVITQAYDRMAPATKAGHTRRAAAWLS
ncbi:cryptochrome/photolyase family protein [Cellulomonas marina]|uniref:Deoxyribodipyrimidine photolyase-related protein n=2 Tax=Cellulomonas marina TaxID=988821 RepID=A0A1I0Z029_9CELL|nr:cryptochrome/photolyase family protein [Cellulomonas marina]SFB18964.1 deoxyribodipyrimidine photolyase-related protein [Cellulomonas marina]